VVSGALEASLPIEDAVAEKRINKPRQTTASAPAHSAFDNPLTSHGSPRCSVEMRSMALFFE
jgi:hypothetical protein